jgi:hypothetical protein
MSDGRLERDEALVRVARNADATWRDVAARAVRFLAETRREFTTDDVWALLQHYYPELGTHEPRALGAVMRQVAREGYIEATGRYRESGRAVCHRNPKKIWRARAEEP